MAGLVGGGGETVMWTLRKMGLRLPVADHPHKAGECAKSNYL